jgi:hypothetical protein
MPAKCLICKYLKLEHAVNHSLKRAVPETAPVPQAGGYVLDKERQSDQNNILTFVHELFTTRKTL